MFQQFESTVRRDYYQARNQLGSPGGVKSFLRGPKFFELCPIISNYMQLTFPGGETFFLRGALQSEMKCCATNIF